MRYMLDTIICIFIIKQKPKSMIQRFMELKPGDTCISSITYAKLVHGAKRSQPDTLIAAHAKSKELTLVSDHIRNFARVNGLIVEDWG